MMISSVASDYRMERPPIYDRECQLNLLNCLKGRKEQVRKLLAECPEIAPILEKMLSDYADCNFGRQYDYYRMPHKQFNKILQNNKKMAKSIIKDLQSR